MIFIAIQSRAEVTGPVVSNETWRGAGDERVMRCAQVFAGCTTVSPTPSRAQSSAVDRTSSSTRRRAEFCSVIIVPPCNLAVYVTRP